MSNGVGAGTWKARAIAAYLTKSSKKGTDGVSIEFEITTEGPCRGEQITWTGWLTDATIDRTIESLRYCGWKGDDLSDLSSARAEAEIVVEEEEFEGRNGEPRISMRVQWVNRLGGGRGVVKTETGDAKSLAARMKARVQASDRAREEADRGNGNPL